MGQCISYYDNNKLKELNNDTPFFSLDGRHFQSKIVDIYDGDTCSIVINLDGKYLKFKLRCLGYDSPEIKPSLSVKNRDELIDLAIKSRNYFISRVTNCDVDLLQHYSKKEVKELIMNNTKLVTLKTHGWDKYGRLLGEIFIDGININNEMVEKKYAYKYDGGTKEKISV
jgi:endonuclease YncB( thermonuclease family)